MEPKGNEKNAWTSLPSVIPSRPFGSGVTTRESMRSKLISDKYSDEAKSEVKRLIDNAVNFLLNREARTLPKKAKVRYLLNVRRYPPELLQYPDIADALELPVLHEELPETPKIKIANKLETIQGAYKSFFFSFPNLGKLIIFHFYKILYMF